MNIQHHSWLFRYGLLVATVCGLALGPAHATPGTDQEAKALADALILQESALPGDTGSRLYEAQFAQTIDKVHARCGSVLSALNIAKSRAGSPEAKQALGNLRNSLSACAPFGTGGVGGMQGLSFAPIPSFAIGGGSDYRR